ncbi:MAG: isoprenylcysteine carboxylmethyltransferase family protein [Thermodesulfovibrionales bacterium]
MTDFLALITLVLWPIIPLFWIPVHCATGFFRSIGLLTYIFPFAAWLPLAYIICSHRGYLLDHKIAPSQALNILGTFLFFIGTSLHVCTGKLLGFRALVGMPELSETNRQILVTKGAFSVVRHPTYLAHIMMLSGAFLLTGVVAVGIVTVLDYVVVNTFIIPFEEKELSERFGKDYQEYKQRVPRFFPRIPLLKGL